MVETLHKNKRLGKENSYLGDDGDKMDTSHSSNLTSTSSVRLNKFLLKASQVRFGFNFLHRDTERKKTRMSDQCDWSCVVALLEATCNV